MFLQVNDSTRFWALINFTGENFAMNILNPTYKQEKLTPASACPSVHTQHRLLVYFLGVVLALLIWLIPWTSSLDMSREAVGKVVVGTSPHQFNCGPHTLENAACSEQGLWWECMVRILRQEQGAQDAH